MKQVLKFIVLTSVLVGAVSLHAQDFNIQLRGTLEYPGQTLANICGFAQNGKEYALVGASKGLSIVDVTNPDNPVEIVQIPGPDNLWKEIKVYSHYAYVTSEGGGGVQIVDLSALPSPNLNFHNYTGSGDIENQLDEIHALHIDEAKGFLYTFGGNFSSARVHDLNVDPYNPVYAGKFDQLGYIHDGFALNDTLYSCHIYAGLLAVVDMRDKLNPKVLGTVETPGRFTHNSWLLDDHRFILTTDETTPSFVTSYDISDPTDIRELDRFSTNDGNNSIGHNTHVLNNWAITSWYTDGVTIVDAHKPDNLVMVGQYDTWPQGTGTQFDGCWGVYPFLPSGNLVVTNIPNTNGGTGKLFVLTPTYARASYLEGQILDGCTGNPLIGATITIDGNNLDASENSKNDGSYKTGLAESGTLTVTVSNPGYVSQTLDLVFVQGQVTTFNTTLEPISAFNVAGKVIDQTTGAALENRTFTLKGDLKEYKIQTNASGQFDLSCIFGGNYRAGSWGYLVADVVVDQNGNLTIPLQPAYYNDFELDLNWTSSGTASDGYWELGEPVGTSLFGSQSNPDFDIDTDNGDQCYVTGNGGGSAGNDDVDGGQVTLSTPVIKLENYQDAVLSFHYWFYNGGGNNSPNDRFEVVVSNGQESATVLTETVSASEWRFSGEISLKNYLPLTDNMRVRFIAYDDNPGHVSEAGIDVFQVVPGLVSSFEPDLTAEVSLAPNPSNSDFQLRYNWPDMQDVRLEVRNLLGQPVALEQLGANIGAIRFGEHLPGGVYLVRLIAQGRQSVVLKAVKQ